MVLEVDWLIDRAHFCHGERADNGGYESVGEMWWEVIVEKMSSAYDEWGMASYSDLSWKGIGTESVKRSCKNINFFSCGLAVMFKEKGESESESVDDFLGGTEGSLEYSVL